MVHNGRVKGGQYKYVCKNCGRNFRDFSDTALENSRMSLVEWMRIIRLMKSQKPVYGIAKRLGRQYRVVHRAIRKFQKALERRRSFEKALWTFAGRQG